MSWPFKAKVHVNLFSCKSRAGMSKFLRSHEFLFQFLPKNVEEFESKHQKNPQENSFEKLHTEMDLLSSVNFYSLDSLEVSNYHPL